MEKSLSSSRPTIRTSADILEALMRVESGDFKGREERLVLEGAQVALRQMARAWDFDSGCNEACWMGLSSLFKELFDRLGFGVSFGRQQWLGVLDLIKGDKADRSPGFDIDFKIDRPAFLAIQEEDIAAMGKLVEDIIVKDVVDIQVRENRLIDDLAVKVVSDTLEGSALAQCDIKQSRLRSGSVTGEALWGLPLKAVITVNRQYQNDLSDHSLFDDVVLHELIHALGFSGEWLVPNMRVGQDLSFGGANAQNALDWAVQALPARQRSRLEAEGSSRPTLYLDNADESRSHWAFGFWEQKQPFFEQYEDYPADQPFLTKDVVSGQLIKANIRSGELMTAVTPGKQKLFVEPWLSWPTIAALEDIGYTTIFSVQADSLMGKPKANMVAIDRIEPGVQVGDLWI